MAIEKVIILNIKDGDVKEAEKSLVSLGHEVESTEKSIKKLDNTTSKAGSNTADAFDGATESAGNLQGGAEGVVSEVVNIGKAAKKGGAALRSAFISTGIGALIVLLGVVIDNWESISEAIGLTNRDLERQQDLIKANIGSLNDELDILDKQKKLLELQGASTEHINELQKQKLSLLREENNALIANLEQQLLQEESQIRQVTTWEKIKIAVAGLVSPVAAAGEEIKASLGNEAQLERLDNLREQLQKAKLDAFDLEIALLDIDKPKTSSKPEEREQVEGLGIDLDSELQKEIEYNEKLKALFKDREDAFKESVEAQTEAQAEALKRQSDAYVSDQQFKQQLEEEESIRKEILAFQTIDIANRTLGAVQDVLGEASGAGKAAAIAQAIINSYAGVTEVLKTPSTLPEPIATISKIANAASILASGFKAVDSIKNTKLPSFAKSSSGGAGGGVQAPSFNVVGTSGVSQLAESLNSQDNPIRAYVVGSDITNQQQLERNIVDTATIG